MVEKAREDMRKNNQQPEQQEKDMKQGTQPGDEVSKEGLAERLEATEAELKACQEKVLRLAAELENFKKRIEREKAEHMKFALEAFAKELLPFLDNLERAVSSAKETKDIDSLIEGLELTLSGYLKTLERFGLKTFAAVGQRFDPSYHEALTVEESQDVEENTVVKELLKGYTLHDRVLRPALVVVSKKPSKDSGQKETNA